VPTYTFRCPTCGYVTDVIASIRDYAREDWQKPRCHDADMERFFTTPDPMAALDLLTSDAIYDGLRAQDGTDISTRSKHREYMRRNNLTTIDDFTETLKHAAQEREARMAGEDPARVRDIVDAVRKLGG
jgi:hypothetical protein